MTHLPTTSRAKDNASSERSADALGSLTVVTLVCACLFLSAAVAVAQERSAAVHPLLVPLLDEPEAGIPDSLRGEMGGFQGRRKIDGREALSLHLRTKASRKELEELGVQVRSMSEGRATISLLPELLPTLAQRSDVLSLSLPRQLRPTLDRSVAETGVVHLRTHNLGQFSGHTGAGVIIGVVDSGIDVDHRNFHTAQGNTRILFAFDQDTGVECNSQQIDTGNCPIRDEVAAVGHGTHVAGIATGNGAAPDENGQTYTYLGMAPEASLVVVKTTFMTDDIIDALHYIFNKADQLGMPAVINLSLGGDIGAHDGTDSMEEEIDTLVGAQSGRVVVVSAGNQRDDSTHAEITVHDGASVMGPELMVPPYSARSGSGNDFILAAGYYSAADDLTVHLFSPNGQAFSFDLSSNTNRACTGANTMDGNITLCNTTFSQIDQSTADREIIVAINDNTLTATPPAAGTWQLAFTGNRVNSDGRVNLWMLSRLGNSGVVATFTTHVSEERTVSIPATGRSAISVGAYTTKLCWSADGEPASFPPGFELGDIAFFSSLGPTRDDRPKPDLAAPGMGVVSVLAEEVRAGVRSFLPHLVVNDDYLLLQGTSQSAPHVTGAVALLFEANPGADWRDILSTLRQHLREDEFTESYDALPWHPIFSLNNVFGGGKLDLGSWGFQDRYESNDTPRTARRLISGQTVAAYLEHDQDLDHFYVAGSERYDQIQVELTGLPADYRLAVIEDVISDSCGLFTDLFERVSDAADAQDERVTGTRYSTQHPAWIRVDSPLGHFDTNSTYTLRPILIKNERSGLHNSTATAQALPEFSEIHVWGNSHRFERDFYSFTAFGTDTIEVDANPGIQLEVLDSRGNPVAAGIGSLRYQPQGVVLQSWVTYYLVVEGVLVTPPNTATAYQVELRLVP